MSKAKAKQKPKCECGGTGRGAGGMPCVWCKPMKVVDPRDEALKLAQEAFLRRQAFERDPTHTIILLEVLKSEEKALAAILKVTS